MVSGAFTNNGFILVADMELDDRFNYKSSDAGASANRPKLVIQYTVNGPTPTPTASATLSATPTPTLPPTPVFSHAAFTYDGDGKRVRSALTTNVGTTTTYFVGNYYETTAGVVTKYYFAGSQRIAMRVGNSLYYLLTDHLGSTSLTTDATGVVVSEMRYSAWGEVRYASGNSPTKYQYTGQFSYAAEFGLLFYNARWYDSYLNHFTQPDSIVPDPYNSQDWDRYSYARNNPIRYTDPSGHRVSCDKDENCNTSIRLSRLKGAAYWKAIISDDFGITMSDEKHTWNETNLRIIYQGLSTIDGVFHGRTKSFTEGSVFFLDGADYGRYSGFTTGKTIIFYTGSVIPMQNFYHEFGHLTNNVVNDSFIEQLGAAAHYADNGTYWFGGNGVGTINTSLLKKTGLYDINWSTQHDGAQVAAIQHADTGPGEQWADLFANYIAGNINLASLGGVDMNYTVESYLRNAGMIP